MKKFYSLGDNEQIFIINPKNNSGILIQNQNNRFIVEEVDKILEKDNILITEIDYQKLKKYLLFEDYYYHEIRTNHNLKDRNKLNKLMDNIVTDLFGKKYYANDIDIIKEQYQVISTFEKN